MGHVGIKSGVDLPRGHDAKHGGDVANGRDHVAGFRSHVDHALSQIKATKLRGVHETRRGPCTPLLLYSGIEAEAAGCLLAL